VTDYAAPLLDRRAGRGTEAAALGLGRNGEARRRRFELPDARWFVRQQKRAIPLGRAAAGAQSRSAALIASRCCPTRSDVLPSVLPLVGVARRLCGQLASANKATAVAAAVILHLLNKRKETGQGLRVFAVSATIGSFILLDATQNIRLPMGFADVWSPWHILIAAAAAIALVATAKGWAKAKSSVAENA